MPGGRGRGSTEGDCATDPGPVIITLVAVIAAMMVLVASWLYRAFKRAERQLGRRLLRSFRVTDDGPRYRSATCVVYFARDQQLKDENGDPKAGEG